MATSAAKSVQRVGAVAILAMVLTFGVVAPASAIRDSGVGVRSCPGQWGSLEVYQRGSGNSWAPGDWSTSPQWNSHSATYRWIYDHQNAGSGGGQWRVYANDTYGALSTGCRPFG